MKTILHLSTLLVIMSSCSSIKPTTTQDIGQYDDVYSSPADDKAEATKPIEPSPIVKNNFDTKAQTPANEPEYRKYKEGEGEEFNRSQDSSSIGASSNYSNSNAGSNGVSSNSYNYDDDDDFSYGKSFNRLRYSDGYSDGYSDALYSNYNNGGGYYNSYYSNPSWGWNRPARSRFWVGYNPWNGWNVGYNYAYPTWGWRTSYHPCYNNYYDPWYGYSGGWGYYSNSYYAGTPYGYYQPFGYSNYGDYSYGYSSYGYPYYGYSNYGYNGYGYSNYGYSRYNRNYRNSHSPWYRPAHVHNSNSGSGYKPAKGKIYGPRETIGSNTPTKSRTDQVAPRGRGGMVQQNPQGGGTTFDPKKDRKDGMVGNPSENGGRLPKTGNEAQPANSGNAGRTEKPNELPSDKNTPGNNGDVAPNKGARDGRIGEINGTKPEFDKRTEAPEPLSNGGHSNNPKRQLSESQSRIENNPSNETIKPNSEPTVRRVREIDRSRPDYGRSTETRPTYNRNNSSTNESSTESPSGQTQSREYNSGGSNREESKPASRSYEPSENRNRTNEQPHRPAPRREETQSTPSPRHNENNDRGNSQPSNHRQAEPQSTPTPRYNENNNRGNSQPSNHRQAEPQSTPTPRTNDGGGNRGGGNNSTPRTYNSGESRSSSGNSSSSGGSNSNGSSSSPNRGRGRN